MQLVSNERPFERQASPGMFYHYYGLLQFPKKVPWISHNPSWLYLEADTEAEGAGD